MISILTPTLNRSEFVARLLNYYAALGFDGWICLGDSSNETHAARNRALVDEYAGRLNILYRYYPSPPYVNDGLCLRALIDEAPTPYAVYAGDDDLLVPAGLRRCAEFLTEHADYSAVGGVGVVVSVTDQQGGRGRPVRADYMGAHRLEMPRAAERWQGYMRNAMSTQYYVHSRETWQRMYRDLPNVPLRYLGPELLPCSWSALLGKVTVVDALTVVFQANAERPFGWNTHSFYGLMLDPKWTPAAQAVRASLTGGLMEADGLTRAEAEAVFDREFWNHMLFMLDWHFQLHFPHSTRNPYDGLRRQKWLLNIYLALKNWHGRKRHVAVSLPGLLRPGARFQADFLPAYQALCGEPVHAL